MLNININYPYPVIREYTDDYQSTEFIGELKVLLEPDGYAVHTNFEINNKGIQILLSKRILTYMKLVYADEKRADFLFPFTEKEYDSMVEKFGKFCVIVNGRELERHINYYCEENECDYIFDKVEYCE